MRRLSFWLAVMAAAQVSNLAVEVLADHVPSLGFKRLVAYTHRGNG